MVCTPLPHLSTLQAMGNRVCKAAVATHKQSSVGVLLRCCRTRSQPSRKVLFRRVRCAHAQDLNATLRPAHNLLPSPCRWQSPALGFSFCLRATSAEAVFSKSVEVRRFVIDCAQQSKREHKRASVGTRVFYMPVLVPS